MISHKELAVSKSESLIGVSQQEYYRVPGGEDSNLNLENNKYLSAVTFSLDLSKYKWKFTIKFTDYNLFFLL